MKISFDGKKLISLHGKVEFLTCKMPCWGMSVLKYSPLRFGLVWMTEGYPECVGRKLFWRLCYYIPNPNRKDWVKVTPNEQ